MRIASVTLGGFKGIRSKATIPLAPVTLLFGANSTGKSSILQGLLYLYEILINQNLSPQYSQLTGQKVYLGGFENLVNGKDLDGVITLGVTLDYGSGNDLWADYLSDAESFLLESTIEHFPEATTGLWSFEIDVAWDHFQHVPYIRQYAVFGGQQLICRIEKSAGKPGSYLNYYNPLPEWEVPEFVGPIAELFGQDLPEPIGFPQSSQALPNPFKRLSLDDVFWGWSETFPDHPLAYKVFFEASLSQAVLAPLQHLRRKLSQLLHIGPLRCVPDHSFCTQKGFDTARWFDGSGGWDAFVGGGDVLRRRVNHWFSSSAGFSTSYQFNSIPHDHDPFGKQYVYVTNQETEISHSLAELGVGLSQVFPFVVAGCMDRTAIVSCEQPELHIHPRWQLILGDFMLNSIKQNPDKTFVVETHSEHLMLRLLRRRRETAEGEDISTDFQCAADDIQIIFCEQENGETRLLPISTTDEGEFDAPWPNGFFHERREELF